jgi:hypothetical protein
MSDYDSETIDDSSKYNNNTDPKKIKTSIPFWSDDPNIILNTKYLFELFPSETMTYSQKLNATSRLVIMLTIVSLVLFGFSYGRSIRILIISIITLYSIHLFYKHSNNQSIKKENIEGFSLQSGPALDMLNEQNISVSSDSFMKPSVENPFSNVLISDYDYNPNKKPAPPITNPDVDDTILTQAKSLVQKLNPNQPNISDKLFRDLGEQFVFEQSLRPFYSNASTTIPNDQSAFADFCYGNMISCKEGNLFACARNNASRHINQ